MFSPRAPLSFSRYVFIERKRIYCKIGNMLLGGKGGFFTELKRRCFGGKADLSRSRKGVVLEKKRIFHRVEKALLRRKSGFITELKALIRRKGGFITELKALIRRKDGFATERIACCVVLKPFKQSYVAAAHQKSV